MTISPRTLPKTLKTYADLLQAVTGRGGVMYVDMMELRDIHGAGKLGIHVTQNISDKLMGMGLGHFPQQLPQQQSERVRIYLRGSAVGKVIDAALTMETGSNRLLRSVANNADSEILKKIKELVCD